MYSGGTAPGDEIFTFMSHTGTHVDAPFHYGPRSADGSPAQSIDELPLEWFFSDGVLLDLRHKQPRDFIEIDDLEQALDQDRLSAQAVGHRAAADRLRCQN